MGESMMIETTTIGLDIVPKSFQLSDGSVVSTVIYDTCGQERYNAINASYYQKADAILLVYDISVRKTFNVIKKYYCPNIKKLCKKDIPIILLGNKTDKEKLREIKTEEGVKLAVQEHYRFKETSCLKNENVADAFEALIEMWNIENHKKNRKRKNSFDTPQKSEENNNLIKTNTFNQKTFSENGEKKTIKLDKKKHNKDENKKRKCCLFK